ncbi:unnamed protein product, partial [Vitis vinifera]|uniref:Uncharacterized protein n=1 Tax=Vitis vinifera TaxID=29760 RepID=D7SQL0_VITVI
MKTESMVFQLMYLDENDMYQSLALVPDLGNAVESLSLGFFEDVYRLVHLMPNPSHCEPNP